MEKQEHKQLKRRVTNNSSTIYTLTKAAGTEAESLLGSLGIAIAAWTLSMPKP